MLLPSATDYRSELLAHVMSFDRACNGSDLGTNQILVASICSLEAQLHFRIPRFRWSEAKAALARRTSQHWQLVLGPLLLIIVLFARGGIDGLLAMLSDKLGRKVRP